MDILEEKSLRGRDLVDKSELSKANQSAKLAQTIAEREESSMAACWNVYLSICPGDSGRYRIFNGRYEALAEREAYYNEDTEDFDIPDQINGVKVFGIEDDWIVGGDPTWINTADTVEFETIDSLSFREWLLANQWDFASIEYELRRAMQSLEETTK
jgi:hypothetical protein